MNFVAIDFETANEKRNSACSLGLVVYEDGEITDKQYWLIKPSNPYFKPYNVAIHGITEDDVRDKPTFEELWPTIKKYISSKTIVAHNASFDMSVLRYQLDEIGEQYPLLDYVCTYIISRYVWPGLPSYRLSILSKKLGISLDHHNALSDALACGDLLKLACNERNMSSIKKLISDLNLSSGYFTCDSYCSPYQGHLSRVEKKDIRAKDILATEKEINIDHPLYNKYVAFTGTLLSMTREQAMQLVCNKGGHCENGVTLKSNYLVLGVQDFSRFAGGEKSNKMKKAEINISNGQNLEIISEDDFLRMQ